MKGVLFDMSDGTYEIRGIRFSQNDLEIIKIDDLAKFRLCPGHLYYFSKASNKPFFMLQAGDVVEENFLSKYRSAGFDSFYILKFINYENIEKFKYHLINLKNAKQEKDRWLERNAILDLFKLNYVITKNTSLLEFLIAFDEVLSKVPSEIVEKYSELSDSLYRRSIICSAFSALIGLLVGYIDFEFIQDLYHLSFFKDYGLVDEKFNYSILKACELERKNPGSGIKHLAKSEQFLDFFKSHPEQSIKKIEDHAKDIFNYPELIKAISMHHELSDGSGFPRGINHLAVSDWESVLTLVEYIVPYSEMIFSKLGDYHLLDLMHNAKENILKKVPTNRVATILEAILSSGAEKEVQIA
jgi:hypothetical protein